MLRMIGTAALLVTTAVVGAQPAAATGPTLGPVTAPGCATVQPGQLHCLARYRPVHEHGTPAAPLGLSPADIAGAYHLDGAPAPATTVAIVDAYDDPNAEADLAVYRAQYGLPACTTANGCFSKVNQSGATTPLPDPGWAVEISLDLDAVSAACPSCHILLVESDSPDVATLGAAEDTAVRLGATVVSNSYGADEYPDLTADAAHWQHPGTSIVASTGDYGFTTASFPAVLGTTIAAIYDSYESDGWLVGGGTSQSAPLIAAMIARSGRVIPDASRIYSHAVDLFDPVGGSNGFCGRDYLCTGKRGYDAPTGMGSPDGLDAL